MRWWTGAGRTAAALAASAPVACGGAAAPGGAQAGNAAGGAPIAAPSGPTQMTIDGKPVTFAGAIATGLGGHAVEIELASHELACEHAAEQHTSGEIDHHLVLTLAPVLERDGTSKWHIVSTLFDDASKLEDSGAVELSGDTQSRVVVELPALKLESGNEPPSALTFPGGALAAQGCNNKPIYMFSGSDTTPPASRPQGALVLTVAGAKQTIDSALLVKKKDSTALVLTTGQQSCTASTDTPDLSYTIHLDAQSHATDAYLGGVIFDNQLSVDFGDKAKAPEVKLGKAAAGEVEVQLRGDYDHGGYAVKLAGSAKALVCERK